MKKIYLLLSFFLILIFSTLPIGRVNYANAQNSKPQKMRFLLLLESASFVTDNTPDEVARFEAIRDFIHHLAWLQHYMLFDTNVHIEVGVIYFGLTTYPIKFSVGGSETNWLDLSYFDSVGTFSEKNILNVTQPLKAESCDSHCNLGTPDFDSALTEAMNILGPSETDGSEHTAIIWLTRGYPAKPESELKDFEDKYIAYIDKTLKDLNKKIQKNRFENNALNYANMYMLSLDKQYWLDPHWFDKQWLKQNHQFTPKMRIIQEDWQEIIGEAGFVGPLIRRDNSDYGWRSIENNLYPSLLGVFFHLFTSTINNITCTTLPNTLGGCSLEYISVNNDAQTPFIIPPMQNKLTIASVYDVVGEDGLKVSPVEKLISSGCATQISEPKIIQKTMRLWDQPYPCPGRWTAEKIKTGRTPNILDNDAILIRWTPTPQISIDLPSDQNYYQYQKIPLQIDLHLSEDGRNILPDNSIISAILTQPLNSSCDKESIQLKPSNQIGVYEGIFVPLCDGIYDLTFNVSYGPDVTDVPSPHHFQLSVLPLIISLNCQPQSLSHSPQPTDTEEIFYFPGDTPSWELDLFSPSSDGKASNPLPANLKDSLSIQWKAAWDSDAFFDIQSNLDLSPELSRIVAKGTMPPSNPDEDPLKQTVRTLFIRAAFPNNTNPNLPNQIKFNTSGQCNFYRKSVELPPVQYPNGQPFISITPTDNSIPVLIDNDQLESEYLPLEKLYLQWTLIRNDNQTQVGGFVNQRANLTHGTVDGKAQLIGTISINTEYLKPGDYLLNIQLIRNDVPISHIQPVNLQYRP